VLRDRIGVCDKTLVGQLDLQPVAGCCSRARAENRRNIISVASNLPSEKVGGSRETAAINRLLSGIATAPSPVTAMIEWWRMGSSIAAVSTSPRDGAGIGIQSNDCFCVSASNGSRP
jgi:hypothetical protein